MENGPFEDAFPIENGDTVFHCFVVVLPEGTSMKKMIASLLGSQDSDRVLTFCQAPDQSLFPDKRNRLR